MKQNISGQHLKRPEIPVIWDSSCRGIPICVSTVNGIQRMGTKKGYRVHIYASCSELMNNPQSNDTVIVVGFESSRLPVVLRELQEMHKRIVVTSMDADHIDAHYSCATFSRRIATEQMLDHLLSLGCNHIALVGCGDRSVNDIVHSDAMEKYIKKYNNHIMGQTFWYHNRIIESFQSFWEKKNDFQAVICPNAFAAVAFLHFCETNQLRVPEQMLLATLKGNRISQCCKPSITSLTVDFDSIGAYSVNVWLFLHDIEDDKLQMRITIPGKISVHESTKIEALPTSAKPLPLDIEDRYEGGPFYEEPTLQALMRIEHCLQVCDELDLRIIGLLMSSENYERIAEILYMSESSIQYRIHNIFKAAQVNSRQAFIKLLEQNFTRNCHFDDAGITGTF